MLSKAQDKDGSFLEFNPGALILQKATSLEQATEIEVHEDAEILFVEKCFPDGLLMANLLFFKKFSNQLRIKHDDQLVLFESFTLSPDNESILPWQKSFPTPYYGSVYLISKKLREHFPSRERIHGMIAQAFSPGSPLYIAGLVG